MFRVLSIQPFPSMINELQRKRGRKNSVEKIKNHRVYLKNNTEHHYNINRNIHYYFLRVSSFHLDFRKVVVFIFSVNSYSINLILKPLLKPLLVRRIADPIYMITLRSFIY